MTYLAREMYMEHNQLLSLHSTSSKEKTICLGRQQNKSIYPINLCIAQEKRSSTIATYLSTISIHRQCITRLSPFNPLTIFVDTIFSQKKNYPITNYRFSIKCSLKANSSRHVKATSKGISNGIY
ncbi:hypothetical protein K9U34_07025 [Lawsonia intracellularis]|uniref:NA n=2 Tax=Lawsonia intracellularis TaxID=29546 RepID=Q1MNN5_LAWIP|nr:hypothetical protein [Lawsonia intracellularis]AGC50760.1 hypothetical protein LAW_30094 [Lawsonia intracellularis N343]CAJ54048.1 NA [Lawsonia intracellularis PHE/MN1-00]KAA0204092.1 hypothetical protein C4K43_06735 [Lawsonia intracellularis]MBZ3893344.1 hypothetical protein [Lawsonia intracellularis]OMQ01656.1 hypothetical protein BW722_07020 [Lawsonia intracellularis]